MNSAPAAIGPSTNAPGAALSFTRHAKKAKQLLATARQNVTPGSPDRPSIGSRTPPIETRIETRDIALNHHSVKRPRKSYPGGHISYISCQDIQTQLGHYPAAQSKPLNAP